MKGKFFVFEGVDGSGKSTTIEKVAENLTNKGYDVFITGEPTYREIGKCFRDLALHKGIDPLTELYLICADRNEHILKDINPAIEQGKIVLCDRFYMSTIAYQDIDLSCVEIPFYPNWVYRNTQDVALSSIRNLNCGIYFIWFDVHYNTYKKRIRKRTDNNLKDIMSSLMFSTRRSEYRSMYERRSHWRGRLYVSSNKVDSNVNKITNFIIKEVEKGKHSGEPYEL